MASPALPASAPALGILGFCPHDAGRDGHPSASPEMAASASSPVLPPLAASPGAGHSTRFKVTPLAHPAWDVPAVLPPTACAPVSRARSPASSLHGPQCRRPSFDALAFPSSSLRPPPRQGRPGLVSRGASKPPDAPGLDASSSSPLQPLSAVSSPEVPALAAGAFHSPCGQTWQRALPTVSSTLGHAARSDPLAPCSPTPVLGQPDSSWDSRAYSPSPAPWSPLTPTYSLVPQPPTPTLVLPSPSSSTYHSSADPATPYPCSSTMSHTSLAPPLPASPHGAAFPTSRSGFLPSNSSIATATSSDADEQPGSRSEGVAVSIPTSASSASHAPREDTKLAGRNPARPLRPTRSLFSLFSRAKVGKTKGQGFQQSPQTSTLVLGSAPGVYADGLAGTPPLSTGHRSTQSSASAFTRTDVRDEDTLPSSSSVVPAYGLGQWTASDSVSTHQGDNNLQSPDIRPMPRQKPYPLRAKAGLTTASKGAPVPITPAQPVSRQSSLLNHNAANQSAGLSSSPAKSAMLLSSALDSVCARRGRNQDKLRILTPLSVEVKPSSPASITPTGPTSNVAPPSPRPSLASTDVPRPRWVNMRPPTPATPLAPSSPSTAHPSSVHSTPALTSAKLPTLASAPTALDSARARSALLARSIQLEADIRAMSTQLWGVRLALGPGGPTGCPCCGGTLS